MQGTWQKEIVSMTSAEEILLLANVCMCDILIKIYCCKFLLIQSAIFHINSFVDNLRLWITCSTVVILKQYILAGDGAHVSVSGDRTT